MISFQLSMKKDPTKIKYFIYARKSTESEDRQVNSINDQLDEIKKFTSGLQVVDTLRESRSAKELGRPVFNDMIERIKRGEANGILCWKVNRLARNPVDGGQILWMLQQGIIQHIKSFERSYLPADNTIPLTVEFGMSNQYSLDLSVDVTRGLRQKAQKGERPGLAPLGYKNTATEQRGLERVLVDEARFGLVRKIFDHMLVGNNTASGILKMANDQWGLRTRKGNKVSKSHIYRILTNPFYYGRYEFPKGSGNWHNGNHQAMITEEEYDQIQYILGKKGKPRPKKHIFAYVGLMKCGECGASITCEEKWKRQKNGNVHHYVYYHCTGRVNPNCTQRSVEEKALEREIADFLSRIEIPPEFTEWAIEELKRLHAIEKKDRTTVLHVRQQEYNECVHKLDSLLDMRMAKEISSEVFTKKHGELEEEKTRLKNILDGVDERVDNWIKEAENTLVFAERARTEFLNGNLERKRQILSALGSNHLLKGKTLSIQTEKPLILMEKVASEVQSINRKLEPAENVIDKRNLGDFYAKSILLSG